MIKWNSQTRRVTKVHGAKKADLGARAWSCDVTSPSFNLNPTRLPLPWPRFTLLDIRMAVHQTLCAACIWSTRYGRWLTMFSYRVHLAFGEFMADRPGGVSSVISGWGPRQFSNYPCIRNLLTSTKAVHGEEFSPTNFQIDEALATCDIYSAWSLWQ